MAAQFGSRSRIVAKGKPNVEATEAPQATPQATPQAAPQAAASTDTGGIESMLRSLLSEFLGDRGQPTLPAAPSVTTTQLSPAMGALAVQDAQEQAAIRSASGITESLGRPSPTAMTEVSGFTTNPQGASGAGVTVGGVDAAIDRGPEQGLVTPLVEATVPEVGTYSIKSGDTLSEIAANSPFTLKQLLEVNQGVDPNRLSIGQEIKLPTVTAEEETPVAEQVTSGFVSSFVDQMAEAEGTEDHQAVEGQFTYAYGILPATARSYGIDPESYPNRREFAEAVYGKMNEQARTDYSEVFNGLSDSDSLSVLSTYINLGRLPSGVVDALSGEPKDFQAAGRSLTNVIHFTNRQTGQKYSSKGVSARRASEYNTLMSGQEGFTPVTQVQVTGTRANPTFNWLAASNNVVETFTSSRNLDPKNSLTTVSVN